VCAWLRMVTGELCARVVMCVCVQSWVAMVRVLCEAKSSLQCVCGRAKTEHSLLDQDAPKQRPEDLPKN